MSIAPETVAGLVRAKRAARWRPRQRKYPTPADIARRHPGWRLSGPLQLINDALTELVDGDGYDALEVTCPPQEGKGIALGTPIATPAGWTVMGELRAGDHVLGGDGRPCTVTRAYSPRLLDCWRVTTANGSELTADGDHRWLVQDRNAEGRPWRVVTTRELRPGVHGLPPSPPLELAERMLPIAPYALGAWLGDGTTSGAAFTCAEPELAEHLAACGEPIRHLGGYRWTFAGPGKNRYDQSKFQYRLRALGLLGNKHIPVIYLRASEKQRLELLQGLMDTDGTVNRNTSAYSRCVYTTTSRRLAEDVLTLTRSLGIHSSMKEGAAKLNGHEVSRKWMIGFTTALPVFRLARKAARLYDIPAPRKPRYINGIRSVERVEPVPTRCIEVDSPGQLFLAGTGLVPTHNSSLCSRYFPEWLLDNNPSLHIAIVSYDRELATGWGREIRQDVWMSGGELRIHIRRDSTAAGRWQTPQGGSMYCVGIGGGLTGKPVDVLIIDDPVKDKEAAESEKVRQTAWNWWEGVGLTRLAPGAKVLVVMTRWHEDDLAGRIAERGSPLRWRRIRLPAIAEAGDPLGRARGEEFPSARGRPPGYFHRLRANMSSYVFAAVYQQNPTAAEGNFFRRATFRHWRPGTPWPDGRETAVLEGGLVVTLADCWRFATMDVAASKKTTADWTVVAMWAVDPMGDLILLDRARERVETHDHFALAAPLLARWGDATIYVERQFFARTFVAAAREAGVGVAEVVADTDKITRAVPAAGRVHAGKVFFPADAAWLGDWEDEIASFPKAAHDDQVDVLAYAERVRVAEWTPKTDPPPARRDPVQEAIDAAAASATGNGHGDLDIMHQGW